MSKAPELVAIEYLERQADIVKRRIARRRETFEAKLEDLKISERELRNRAENLRSLLPAAEPVEVERTDELPAAVEA